MDFWQQRYESEVETNNQLRQSLQQQKDLVHLLQNDIRILESENERLQAALKIAENSTTTEEFDTVSPPAEEMDRMSGEQHQRIRSNEWMDIDMQSMCERAITEENSTVPRSISKLQAYSVELNDSEEGTRANRVANLPTNPNSINCEHIFEEFFILEISKNETSEILFQYPQISIKQGSVLVKQLGKFCFPKDPKVRKLNTDDDFYESNCSIRDENWFIFTMPSQNQPRKLSQNFDDPNKDRDTYYCVCLAKEEIVGNWIYPRCYWFVTSYPCFEIHYRCMNTLLAVQLFDRLNYFEFNGQRRNFGGISDAQLLLHKFYQVNPVDQSMIHIVLESTDFQEAYAPKCWYSDIEWFWPVLFSLIKLQDLYFLFWAAMQEKSIVFLSENLNSLTSWVLGLQALLRPLKWCNVSIPILPKNNAQVLESPVPFMAGIPWTDEPLKGNEHVIWVMLDSKTHTDRLQVAPEIHKEVFLPWADNLQGRISKHYREYSYISEPCYRPCEIQLIAACKVAKKFNKYLYRLLSPINHCTYESFEDLPNIKSHIEPHVDIKDLKFIANFMRTQLFVTHVETMLN